MWLQEDKQIFFFFFIKQTIPATRLMIKTWVEGILCWDYHICTEVGVILCYNLLLQTTELNLKQSKMEKKQK